MISQKVLWVVFLLIHCLSHSSFSLVTSRHQEGYSLRQFLFCTRLYHQQMIQELKHPKITVNSHSQCFSPIDQTLVVVNAMLLLITSFMLLMASFACISCRIRNIEKRVISRKSQELDYAILSMGWAGDRSAGRDKLGCRGFAPIKMFTPHNHL